MHDLGVDDLARLRAVAAEVALQTHEGLDEAIELAEHLVAVGVGGEATLKVAMLERGAVRGEAEPRVRDMLAELGLVVPSAEDEPARYRLLLWLFGYADLPLSAFEGPFYARLMAWDQQSDLDRTLMSFLHQRDELTRPAELAAVEEEMRVAVRSAIPKS